MVGSAMQSSTISNATSSSNEVVSGNYSLGNTSIGNDSLYNSSKFNISEYNRSNNNNSSDNTTIGNTSLNNFSRDTISEDVSSRNIHNANKIDTSHVTIKGGTDTMVQKGIGSITFGSDGKIASMQEEKSSIANTVSSSQGVNHSDSETRNVAYGFDVNASKNPNGNNNASQGFFANVVSKAAGALGIHGGINENSSSSTNISSGTQMVNDQVYTQQTIEHLNSKYSKEYIKNNMEEVFREANTFQANLSGTRGVDSTKTGYTYAKEILTPNSGEKAEVFSKEIDEFEQSLKNKK